MSVLDALGRHGCTSIGSAWLCAFSVCAFLHSQACNLRKVFEKACQLAI